MQGEPRSSPQVDYCANDDDVKYFAGLSTILVATIQEVKDRVSQIEFIFCSQLFPNFQSRTISLKQTLVEARKAAEDEWKKKEISLLRQIEGLQQDKLLAQEQAGHILASLEQEKIKLVNAEKLLSSYETEKKELLTKLESLEKSRAVIELQEELKKNNEEIGKSRKSEEQLMQQIDLKDCELSAERDRRKETMAQFMELKSSYKELKSQYNFLLKRLCPNPDNNKLMHHKTEELRDSPRDNQDQPSSPDSRGKNPDTSLPAPRTSELKMRPALLIKIEGNRDAGSVSGLKTVSSVKLPSNSNSYHEEKSPTTMKNELQAGLKRSSSSWRETRSRQEPGGADPHDDFLDTPLENARRNRNKAQKGDVLDIPALAPKDMDFDNSDDETQDLNANAHPQKQHLSIPRPENRGYKYVEPVRKKSERENLKGVECKQCKKFYDAVLPDGDKENRNNNINGGQHLRCEHHDGVSRHRYRYAPPMTPEGFWNIGFDSDM